ncbi:MAG: 3-isopropylmalate dehydratase large subunit [Oscillospiraceae bacterium]|nr:3-isopropylmalate dehydratase large subunit [Oscillospiraceae bacterium]
MTLTEKILARASGRDAVKAGEIVTAKIDLAIIQDALGPIVYKQFRELGVKIWDVDKVMPVIDHNCLHATMENAAIIDETAKFVEDYGIPGYGNMRGVSHQLAVESGKFLPGDVAVGTDSHTCTYGGLGGFSTGIGSTEMCAVLATGELWFKVPKSYYVNVTGELPDRVMSKDVMLKLLATIGANGATYRALEFHGDTIDNMSVSSRLTLCNMAIECGAKNGIVEADEKTREYFRTLGIELSDAAFLRPDTDAVYERKIDIDAAALEPMVAVPFSPANGVAVSKVEGEHLDQVIIGACTNGRFEDLKVAADILRGKKIPTEMRCFVVPASNRVYSEASRAGVLADLADAGCTIVNPGCGGCGIQMPMLPGQRCLGTHNRNFRGRMGSPESLVYLASPATAAASALCGYIADPRKV